MLLVIGAYKDAERLIRDKGINPRYCRIVSRPEQLHGTDRGTPALLAHNDMPDREYDEVLALLRVQQIAVLN